eukprot:4023854-Pyramimonas_sp.AAC.1
MNYGQSKPGHARAPGKCKFAKPWKLPDNHGQTPLVPAEPAALLPKALAAPPPEAQAAQRLMRLRAPRPGSRADPTVGASSRDITVGRRAAGLVTGQPASSGAGSSDGHIRLPQVRVRRGRQQEGDPPPPPLAGNPAARPRLPDWS